MNAKRVLLLVLITALLIGGELSNEEKVSAVLTTADYHYVYEHTGAQNLGTAENWEAGIWVNDGQAEVVADPKGVFGQVAKVYVRGYGHGTETSWVRGTLSVPADADVVAIPLASACNGDVNTTDTEAGIEIRVYHLSSDQTVMTYASHIFETQLGKDYIIAFADVSEFQGESVELTITLRQTDDCAGYNCTRNEDLYIGDLWFESLTEICTTEADESNTLYDYYDDPTPTTGVACVDPQPFYYIDMEKGPYNQRGVGQNDYEVNAELPRGSELLNFKVYYGHKTHGFVFNGHSLTEQEVYAAFPHHHGTYVNIVEPSRWMPLNDNPGEVAPYLVVGENTFRFNVYATSSWETRPFDLWARFKVPSTPVPLSVMLNDLFVDDGFYRPLFHNQGNWLPWLGVPIEVKRAPGDLVDLTATVFNWEREPVAAQITVTIPTTVTWTLEECYTSSDAFLATRQNVACTTAGNQYRFDVDLPAYAARHYGLRFRMPDDQLTGEISLSADLGLEEGDPQYASHQEASFQLVDSAPAFFVTNRELLYEKYEDYQAAALLQDLSRVATGAADGSQEAVIYYADRYDDAVANWDNTTVAYTDTATANQVASIVDDHIVTWTQKFTPTYLMIIGSDDIVPFYRVSDASLANSERNKNYPAGRPAFDAIRHNYFLTDVPYADTSGGDWLQGELELAVGRLVGVDAQAIRSLLGRGLQGLGDSINAFVGSDSRNDVDDVVDELSGRGLTIRNDGGADDTTESDTWSKTVMTTAMELGFTWFAHSNHGDYSELSPGTGADFLASEVASISTRSPGAISDNRPFVSTSGCHSGLVADGDGMPEPDDNMVWAFLSEGASAYLGSSGYVYLYDPGIGLGEEWFNSFYSEVVTQSHTIGQAFQLACQNYNPGGPYERRSVAQFTLFGVPWMEPRFPAPIVAASSAQGTIDMGYWVETGQPQGTAGNYTRALTFTVVSSRVVSVDGYEIVDISGGDLTTFAFKPIVPRLYAHPYFYLPPGASVTGISVTYGVTASLGSINIPSAWPETTTEPTGGYTDTDVVGIYPGEIGGYDSSAFADHTEVRPFIIAVQHDPQTQETWLWQTAVLEIDYQAPAAVVITDFSTDRTQYGAGEAINAGAIIVNPSSEQVSNLVAVLEVKNAFGQVEGSVSSSPFSVAAGEVVEVAVPFSGMLTEGTYRLVLSVEDASAETLASSTKDVKVSSGQIVGFNVSAENVGWDPITFTLTYRNDSLNAQQAMGQVELSNLQGAVATFTSTTTIEGGQMKGFVFNWQPPVGSRDDFIAVATVGVEDQRHGPVTANFKIIVREVYLPIVLRGS